MGVKFFMQTTHRPDAPNLFNNQTLPIKHKSGPAKKKTPRNHRNHDNLIEMD